MLIIIAPIPKLVRMIGKNYNTEKNKTNHLPEGVQGRSSQPFGCYKFAAFLSLTVTRIFRWVAMNL